MSGDERNPAALLAFNHAYDIAFSLDTLIGDPYTCLDQEKERVKKALLDRVENVFSTDEWIECLGHVDSYEFPVAHDEVDEDKTNWRKG